MFNWGFVIRMRGMFLFATNTFTTNNCCNTYTIHYTYVFYMKFVYNSSIKLTLYLRDRSIATEKHKVRILIYIHAIVYNLKKQGNQKKKQYLSGFLYRLLHYGCYKIHKNCCNY